MLIIPAVRFQIRQNITVSPVPFSPKRPVLISEAPCAYFPLILPFCMVRFYRTPVFLLPPSSSRLPPFLFPPSFFARVYIIYNVYMIKSRSF